MAAPEPRAVRASGRVYARLLVLLPAEFRAAYGQLAVQTFRDMCSAGVRERGRRGLLAVWARVLPDLVASAAYERSAHLWRRAGDRPPAGARLAAAALPALAALLVVYSQLRYPANLALPGYAVPYLMLLACLAALTAVLLVSRVAAPPVVLCGFASAPAWALMFHIARAGAPAALLAPVLGLIAIAGVIEARRAPSLAAGTRTGAVTGTIAGVVEARRTPSLAAGTRTGAVTGTIAGVVEARRTPSLAAGTRAGAVTGTIAGLVMLVVTVVDGLAGMASAGQDTRYVTEFARSGQHSLPAYVIGERIAGGAYTILFAVAAGALIGLVATALARRVPGGPAVVPQAQVS